MSLRPASRLRHRDSERRRVHLRGDKYMLSFFQFSVVRTCTHHMLSQFWDTRSWTCSCFQRRHGDTPRILIPFRSHSALHPYFPSALNPYCYNNATITSTTTASCPAGQRLAQCRLTVQCPLVAYSPWWFNATLGASVPVPQCGAPGPLTQWIWWLLGPAVTCRSRGWQRHDLCTVSARCLWQLGGIACHLSVGTSLVPSVSMMCRRQLFRLSAHAKRLCGRLRPTLPSS